MSVYHHGVVLWILNCVTAGLHLVWALTFIILWGVSEEADGSRNDLVYPLYTSFSTWGETTEAVAATSYGECPERGGYVDWVEIVDLVVHQA